VTDTIKAIKVTYNGILPDLFREGQGVVAEGVIDGGGTFRGRHGAGEARRELHAEGTCRLAQGEGRLAA
jgi:hypothetical protein